MSTSTRPDLGSGVDESTDRIPLDNGYPIPSPRGAEPGRRHRWRASAATVAIIGSGSEARPTGRRVLVMGGRAAGTAVPALLAAQCRVALHAAGTDGAFEWPDAGHAVIQADPSDPSAISDLFDDLQREFGGVDVVLDGAALDSSLPGADEQSWADTFSAALSTELLSTAILARAAAQARTSGAGPARLIVLQTAFHAGPTEASLAAGRSALLRALGEELRPRGVDIAVVTVDPADPGWTDWLPWLLDAPAGAAVNVNRGAPAPRPAQ